MVVLAARFKAPCVSSCKQKRSCPCRQLLVVMAASWASMGAGRLGTTGMARRAPGHPDRKSTRLNSSHSQISYAVFCLKKKKKSIKYLHARTDESPSAV